MRFFASLKMTGTFESLALGGVGFVGGGGGGQENHTPPQKKKSVLVVGSVGV